MDADHPSKASELPDAEDDSIALVDPKVLEEEGKLREERRKQEEKDKVEVRDTLVAIVVDRGDVFRVRRPRLSRVQFRQRARYVSPTRGPLVIFPSFAVKHKHERHRKVTAGNRLRGGTHGTPTPQICRRVATFCPYLTEQLCTLVWFSCF